MNLADSFFVGCAVLAFCIYFGHWVDTVINRALPGNSGRSEAPRWWRRSIRCKLGMHRVRRFHMYIGDGEVPSSYCPDCDSLVKFSHPLDSGWVPDRLYGGRKWVSGKSGTPAPKPRKGLPDMREVYWSVDPIETRVVRSGPHPGTTGDIKPELYAHPADYESYEPRQDGHQVKLGWSTEGRKAGFTYDERDAMVDKAIETGDISPLLQPELCCWCGLPFVSANGTVMCHHCMEHFRV